MQIGNWTYSDKNTTVSSTQAPTYSESIHLDSVDKIAICQCVFVFLTGALGNSLIVYILGWKKRKERNTYERFLLILSITDLLSSFIVPLLFMYGTITKFMQWDFGYVGCKILVSVLPITVTLSHGILILISYERYRATTNPLGSSFRKFFINLWMLITLCIAFLIVSPYAYSLTIDKDYGGGCLPSHFLSNQIFALGSLLRDIIATIALIILSGKTTNAIRKSDTVRSLSSINHRRYSKRTKKMLTVLVCVFSTCVIPADLFQVGYYTYYMVHGDPLHNNYENVKIDFKTTELLVVFNTFLQILQVSNSAWNIFIYSRMQKDVRRTIRVLFVKLRCSRVKRKTVNTLFTSSSRIKESLTGSGFVSYTNAAFQLKDELK